MFDYSKISLCLVLTVLLIFTACGLLSSDEKEKILEPGPRNYAWQVDTLYSPPGGFVYDIWGSSPNDLWAVLGGGINTLWHFNGEEWSVWPEQVGPAFYSIYGFAQDDVWMGGNDGKLYHFDGERWKLSFQLELSEALFIDLNTIFGESSNLYVAGIVVYPDGIPNSFLLNYDGRNWKKVLITDFKVQLQRIRWDRKGIFLQGVNIHSQPDSMFFYKLEGARLKEKFSISGDKDIEIISLNKIGKDIYFAMGNVLHTYEGKEFKPWHTVLEPNFGYQIYGRHKKDIFLRMKDGLAHYNGEDTQYLFNYNNFLFSLSNNAMLFDEEVFFIVNDFDLGTNYIYHGTLISEEE